MKIKKWQAVAAMTAALVLINQQPAMAAVDPMDGLWPLISMVQRWIKPIAIIIAFWGLVEMGLENPSGKGRIRTAFIIYIGSFLIPYVFDAIGRSFGH